MKFSGPCPTCGIYNRCNCDQKHITELETEVERLQNQLFQTTSDYVELEGENEQLRDKNLLKILIG